MLAVSLSTEGFLPLEQLPWISKCSYEIGSHPKLNNILEEGGKSSRVAPAAYRLAKFGIFFLFARIYLLNIPCLCLPSLVQHQLWSVRAAE